MDPSAPQRSTDSFQTTHWTNIWAGTGHTEQARQAQAELYTAYRRPLERTFRILLCRYGDDPDRVEDLTQGFFTRLVEKDLLSKVQKDGPARFRTWITRVAENYFHNEREPAFAQKRGSGQAALSLNEADVQAPTSPGEDLRDHALDRAWALATFARIFAVLRASRTDEAQGYLEILKPYLAAVPDYDQLARDHGATRNAWKVRLHRLRDAFKNSARAVVAQIVPADEVEDHLRYLSNFFHEFTTDL